MTKEVLERAKQLDENLYYINNLLYALKEGKVVFSSTVTGNSYRLCDLDPITCDLVIKSVNHILSRRKEEMTRELEKL